MKMAILTAGCVSSLEGESRQLKVLSKDFRRIRVSTVSDVLDRFGIRGILSGFHSISTGAKIVGTAMTVKELSGDLGEYSLEDFRIGEVIDNAESGDVIILDNGGRKVSTWGYLASLNAKLKGIAGAIVYGGVRDIEEIRGLNFPVFAEHIILTSGKRRIKVESMNVPIKIQDVKITPGDLVVADSTGIAIIPQEEGRRVLEEAKHLEELERVFVSRIKRGASLSELSRKYKHM